MFDFSGDRIEDINQYIIPIIKKSPDYLIFRVGTKDTTRNISKKTSADLLTLKYNIFKQAPGCRIIMSKLIIQHDDGKAKLISNVNKHLPDLQSGFIENDSIRAWSVYNIFHRKEYISSQKVKVDQL